MSAPNQTAFAVLSQVALAADGAVLGLALAYIAVRSVLKFKTTSSSLNKVKKAPPASPISFLSSVILLIKSQIRLLSVMRGSSSFEESWRRNPSSTVPFILVDGGNRPKSDYLKINMDESKHPLPLKTVGLLDEEKILPVGKEITAVGLVSLKNGILEVMACRDLPFFL
uniref:RING-type E3 ubiquitin transferase n=1 Tax=Lactuca sativa TaxID=4236 RepID=A0A9R1XDK8_LACSA|nr:hypothetical protein LSAT_V11C500277820 [Lactuca sativa]